MRISVQILIYARVQLFVDKITNSIEEKVSGKRFNTSVQPTTEKDLKRLFKKDGWQFPWKLEFKIPDRQIFKLHIDGDSEIQGLLSIEVMKMDRYVEMHLIESAPHNYGRNKRFVGVPANLVAFACKMSFDLGFDGHVAFTAKTKLIQHYKITLGAQNFFGNNRMVLIPAAAKKLVNSYFKNYFDDI